MDKFDIHRRQNALSTAFDRLGRDERVSQRNKELILSFAKNRLAKGISRLRVCKCIWMLGFMACWLKKPFDQADKDDFIGLVGEVQNQQYQPATKYDFKVILKLFMRWLKGNDEEYPVEIKWLKPNFKRESHLLPEELLTEEEVLRLAQAADNPRDKALVLTLYETGCRIGELLSLAIKNVQFDSYGAVLRVFGKILFWKNYLLF